jgi:hypothetical protein
LNPTARVNFSQIPQTQNPVFQVPPANQYQPQVIQYQGSQINNHTQHQVYTRDPVYYTNSQIQQQTNGIYY